MNSNNKIKARIPIAIMILAYVIIEFAYHMMRDSYRWGELFKMLPIILLGVYFLGMYKKQQAAPYLVFALTSLGASFTWGWNVSGGTSSWDVGVQRVWLFLLNLFGGHISGVGVWHAVLTLLASGAAAILMCIAIFLIVKGSKKSKLMLIIAFALASLNAFGYIWYLLYYGVGDLTMYILRAFAHLLVYTALILYAALNNPAEGIGNGTQLGYKTITQMTPNEALAMLKDKFELGLMTEEEYKAQRAEIISKL